jgi:hypothetical protein
MCIFYVILLNYYKYNVFVKYMNITNSGSFLDLLFKSNKYVHTY